MDYKKIQELLRYFEASSLTTLNIEEGDFKLSLSKLTTPRPQEADTTAIITNPDLAKLNPLMKDQLMGDPKNAFLRSIRSPLVGTFYSGTSPDCESCVHIGQEVKKGDTVCIIEAMKIMNEIASPYTGVIEKILVSDGAVIGFNQELMVIRLKE